MVHEPASATTATSTVTQAVTTVAASPSGTATAVTPLKSTRTTSGLIRPLFGALPRLVLGRDFRAHVGDRDRWAYYSEHVVQGIRDVGDRHIAPRNDVRVESPLSRLPPRKQPRQRWYTPAQNFSEICYASTDSSSYAGLASDGDEDARVLHDLERRSKTWHDEEAARAREVKRRGWEKAEAAAERAARERFDRRINQQPAETRAPGGPIAREKGNGKNRVREPSTLKTRQWRSRASESSGESP